MTPRGSLPPGLGPPPSVPLGLWRPPKLQAEHRLAPATLDSPHRPQPLELRPSFARLHSLADGAMKSRAGGPHDVVVFPVPAVGAVRVCSSSAPPSRGAVTRRAAAGRGRGATATSALTATAAHNRARSAGRVAHLASIDLQAPTGVPRPADLRAAVAMSASSSTGALGTTAPPSFIAHFLPNTTGRWAGWSGGEGTPPAAHSPSTAPKTSTRTNTPTKETR